MILGIAIKEITPDGPVRMIGYGDRLHDSDGVRDPLTCTALYFKSDDREFVMVELDLCIMGPAAVAAVQTEVEKRSGISKDCIVLHFSHTHSGPDTIAIHDDPAPWAKAYYPRLLGAISEAVIAAKSESFEGRIDVRIGSCHMAVNRRHLDDPINSQLTLLSLIDQQEQVRGVCFHYGCHPTAFGVEHYQISSDWVGYVRDAITPIVGAPVCFIQGAQGDLDPVCRGALDMADPDQAVGSSPQEVRTTAYMMVNAIKDTLVSDVVTTLSRVTLDTFDVTVPLRYGVLSDDEIRIKVQRWKEMFADFLDCPVSEVPENETINSVIKEHARKIDAPYEETLRMVAEQFTYTTFLWMYRGAESHIDSRNGTARMRCSSLRFDGLRFLGIPAEPLVAIGLEYRKQYEGQINLIGGLCGGWTGYLPHRSNFEQTDANRLYETISTLYREDATERILKKDAELG